MRKSLFCFPVALLLVLASCGQNTGPARRVLLITLDTVRADALACYELPNMSAQTPHLDALAAEGTLFRRATCQIPATLTSHTAIFSGRMPRSTGVRFGSDRVPDHVVTLAELCKEAGFTTAAFLSSSVLNQTFGLNQGFDVYNDLSEAGNDPEAERDGQKTTDLALQWLTERKPDEPFFLWVHYYDAHSPYEPKPEFDTYGPEGYDGPIDGSTDQVSRFVASKGKGVSKADLQRLRALYLGEVEYLDRQVGRLLEGFDNTSPKSPGAVFVLADHGENLGEDGRYFHGADLYETCMHIPLIIRWPGGIHAGVKVEDLAAGMDIMPTAAAACGLDYPQEVQGIDLASLLTTQNEEKQPVNGKTATRTALLETEGAYRCDADKLLGAVNLRWKLIDHHYHRREPVLVGRALRYSLDGPCYLRAMVRGAPTAQLVAHIRFHTPETVGTEASSIREKQPTILVTSSRFGIEAIHQQYELPQVPNGWSVIATTDLYERAISYGKIQGWPLQNMQIESIAMDAGGTPGEWKVDIYLDDVVLVGNKTTIIDDFDDSNATIYQDAGVGPKHAAGSRVELGQGINGSPALRIVAQFPKENNIWTGSELYFYEDSHNPLESKNLLAGRTAEQIPSQAKDLGIEIDNWLKTEPAPLAVPAFIDPELEEALRSLGYW